MLKLKINQNIDYLNLLEAIKKLNYTHVNMVFTKGDYTYRGAIIDIFPYQSKQPIRIELDNNTIERLCSFNPHDQLMLSKQKEIKIHQKTATQSLEFEKEHLPQDTRLLENININDYIVHENYGIGQFKGFVRLKIQKEEEDFLHLKYQGEDKIYVPINQLQHIHLYSESKHGNLKLTKLTDNSWQKTCSKAHKATEELAQDLYQLYKKRTSIQGLLCEADTVEQIDFEHTFPHSLTPDQITCLKDIKEDMQSPYPMDRLLVGDVGFGKTELLLRATFKAIQNGYQVLILVPTTLLAEQHTKTCLNRFKNEAVLIEKLSRNVPEKEREKIVQKFNSQTCDLLIGTHQLLHQKLNVKKLGLLIIDEEHRFGVKHKEIFKTLKPNIDVLSVSATPIPRSLQQALTGAADVSIIRTPPKKRKPIITEIKPFSQKDINQAIKKELKRKGQCFYVVNKINQLTETKERLKSYFPNIQCDIIHSKIKSDQNEKRMSNFINKKTDILIATTMIENGLDIPNSNTIIIENIEQFGLSQIHQLRGRVGRSDRQAYAYGFIKKENLSKEAKARLSAIRQSVYLGAGYHIAQKDLEIRGAGNLFGKEQHGHIISIGFVLFCQLLEAQLNKLKGKKSKITEEWLTLSSNKIQLPSHYIKDQKQRLIFYQKIQKLKTTQECKHLINQIEDRFGKMPKGLKTVFTYIKRKLT